MRVAMHSRWYSALLSIPVLIICQGGFLFALDTFPQTLEIEAWVQREPFSMDDPGSVREARKTESELTAELQKQVLEEAQYVLSGMIFGFSFVYIPLDRARNVAEVFTLGPVGTIPWGDANLRLKETRLTEDMLVCGFSYTLKGFQENWYTLWQSNDYPGTGALGTASVFGGPGEKYRAVENAVKEAVREYARQRVSNKPKKIEGEVVFAAPPRVVIDAGSYTARVRIKLNIKKITGYMRY